MAANEVLAIVKGVFLRAADDQTCNDVNNVHAARAKIPKCGGAAPAPLFSNQYRATSELAGAETRTLYVRRRSVERPRAWLSWTPAAKSGIGKRGTRG